MVKLTQATGLMEGTGVVWYDDINLTGEFIHVKGRLSQ